MSSQPVSFTIVKRGDWMAKKINAQHMKRYPLASAFLNQHPELDVDTAINQLEEEIKVLKAK